METSFKINLGYAIQHRFGPGYRDKQLASALNVDRSTVNRLRKTVRSPNRERLEALAAVFEIAPDDWTRPVDEFRTLLDNRPAPGSPANGQADRAVTMAAITANRFLWKTCRDIHGGQYIAYWKAYGIDGHYVASLAEVGDLKPTGIAFSLVNPYIREDSDNDEFRSWTYNGVLYPVSDYLYVFCEQDGSRYELFTMIMTASPLAPPDLLRGCLSGIYVRDGRKQIAVSIMVVMMFLAQPIPDWRREAGKRLGKIPARNVPDRVRRLMDPYPGVIPLD